MSFSYRNRMPYYAWGANLNYNTAFLSDSAGYFGISDDSDLLRPAVPLLEEGGSPILTPRNRAYFRLTSPPFDHVFDSAPVDRQIPWKAIVAYRGPSLGYLNAVGLTLHGEIYGVQVSFRGRGGFGSMRRRVFRINSRLASVPFSGVFPNNTLNGPLLLMIPCVSRDGDPFLLEPISRDIYSGGESEWLVSVPEIPGERVRRLWVSQGTTCSPSNRYILADDILLAVTESGRTYVRLVSRTWLESGGLNPGGWRGNSIVYKTDWIRLDTGVVSAKVKNRGGFFALSSPPPTISVAPPPEGGETASLIAEWMQGDRGGWEIYRIYVARPGHGYSSAPAVSFSSQPVSGQPPLVTLDVFTSSVVRSVSSTEASDRSLYATADGGVYQVTVPPTSLPYAGVWSGSVADRNLRPVSSVFGAIESDVPQVPPFALNWLVKDKISAEIRSSHGDGVFDFVTPATYDNPRTLRYTVGSSGALYATSGSTTTLIDAGPWACIDSAGGNVAAVKQDGGLYTWGDAPALYGDGTSSIRQTPTRIAATADWLSCTAPNPYRPLFIAIRKDDVCRSIDQPMEYWPDSYFS